MSDVWDKGAVTLKMNLNVGENLFHRFDVFLGARFCRNFLSMEYSIRVLGNFLFAEI